MRRTFWFVAGAGTGVYVMTKARRTAEVFTPDGLRDRMAGLSLGARLFREEVGAEMATRENDLRLRLGLRLDGSTSSPVELPAARSSGPGPHQIREGNS